MFLWFVQPSAVSHALKCGLDGLRGKCQNHQMRKNSIEKRQMLGSHCKMMECLKSNQLNANGFECQGLEI